MADVLADKAISYQLNKTQSCYRLMRLDDVKSVFDIDQDIYPFPWSEGIFEDCIKTGHLCIVNEVDSEIIAYGIVGMIVDESHILNLSVSRAYQGKGYGRELLMYLLELVKRGNATRALLEVRQSNQVALNLYTSLEFEKIGLRKAYYPAENGREDAIVLAKPIT
ncbi:MAG: ribosomal protein S18-alanine N-acetyltransferase [Gammaproteobacteria bacterium]|nr:ribosomal protein S18-alanine N-acetyltransferase [Gammaproteobacteria bacterium]